MTILPTWHLAWSHVQCLFSTYVRVKCVHKMFYWGIPILISTRASSMYNSSKNKLSTIYLFEEQDTSEGAEWFHIDGQGGYSPLNYLHLIFEKSSLINWIFAYFELVFYCLCNQPTQFKLEIDKKSSLSNLIFQTRFFKNQVQINRWYVRYVNVFVLFMTWLTYYE